jgi:hypothetical protein
MPGLRESRGNRVAPLNDIIVAGAIDVEDVLAAALLQGKIVDARVGFELEVTQVCHDDGVSKVRIKLSTEHELGASRRWALARVAGVAFYQDVFQLVCSLNVRVALDGAELDVVQIVETLVWGNEPRRRQVHAHVQQSFGGKSSEVSAQALKGAIGIECRLGTQNVTVEALDR